MTAASSLAMAAAAVAAAALTWWGARRERDRAVAREREDRARTAYRADAEISRARRDRREFEQLLAEARAADTAAQIVDSALKEQGFNWWER